MGALDFPPVSSSSLFLNDCTLRLPNIMALEPFRAHFDQAQWMAKIDLDRKVCDPSLF